MDVTYRADDSIDSLFIYPIVGLLIFGQLLTVYAALFNGSNYIYTVSVSATIFPVVLLICIILVNSQTKILELNK